MAKKKASKIKKEVIKTEETKVVIKPVVKPVEEIVKYIEQKKGKYIKEICSQETSLCVFNPAYYGDRMTHFNRIPFGCEKTFDSWFVPEKEK